MDRTIAAALVEELGLMKTAIPLATVRRAVRIGRGFARGVGGQRVNMGDTLYGRLRHPIQGLSRGWQRMSPRGTQAAQLDELARPDSPASRGAANRLLRFGKATQKAQVAGQALPKAPDDLIHPSGRFMTGIEQAVQKTRRGGAFRKTFGTGEHLLQNQEKVPILTALKSGPKGFAEELSRRGWTGQSRATKYVPIGSKGLTGLFAASAVPGIRDADPPSRTGGEGAWSRGLGEAAGTLGFIGGAGLPLIPGVALGLGTYAAGKRIGRTIDRLRAGASADTAFNAPTPDEAVKQIQKVQRYYGNP